jgi:hypothetical protein
LRRESNEHLRIGHRRPARKLLSPVYWLAPMKEIALESPVSHWELALVGALVWIAAATVAHVTIERPGIAFGRRINKRSFPFFKI